MTAAPDNDDVVMDRLVREAQREFPGWRFTRTSTGWSANLGPACHAAASLAELRANLRTASPDTPAWSRWRSDTGRYWATRHRPFSRAAEREGACRTVEADTEAALHRLIREQEQRAMLADRESARP
ncbi:hypothetical protein [Thermoactinospora rubra]|uniref:hypothetical protein n=1 Tax=Thermoactinospora rubra TaxID=1088767 RepID=UPI00197CEB36|nr:hypothetical protein [Thermoactinospora rubra]